ncbi:response regulator [Consotaella aegiceratis]|uniref:response regulator n=1 Tax=Consotaella aegiceratis TaxID=3097961 RepID=UPI002F400DDA
MPTILVIDDQLDVLRALGAILRSRLYDVRAASGGREGLALFARGGCSAVIVDIFMPDLDGIGTIRQMHEINPEVPIIAMTGHPLASSTDDKPDFLQMAVALGAFAALRKPFMPDKLMRTLEAAIYEGQRESRSPAASSTGAALSNAVRSL